MSKLHFSENLFVDNLELRKLSSFIFEDGWEEMIKNKIGSFGVLKNTKIDPDFTNFKITQGNFLSGNPTIVVDNGTAVGYDSVLDNIDVIKNNWNNPIIFPNNGKYHWIKIEAEENLCESGIVSVDTSGNLVGVGTKFEEVLRGQPNFPQKVRFYRIDPTDNYTKLPSIMNDLEYTVSQVIDDQNVILQGSFNNEANLYFEVVGTFTPGYIPSVADKGIYRYDGCKISIIEEVSATGFPLKPFHSVGQEFCIYRIKYDSGQMIIEDYRNELFKLDSEFDIEYVSNDLVPHIGLTKVNFMPGVTKEINDATVEWGFRSSSYDVFINEAKITILAGSGGKYKSANDFSNSDFDRYRLYVIDSVKNDDADDYYSSFEKIFKIKTSQKNGTAIDLFLENFSPLDLIPENFNPSTNYTSNNKVNTTSGQYKLLVASLTAISPVQPIWNTGTIYSVSQFVSYLGATYENLQPLNSGNQPDASPTFWRKTWVLYKSEILVVPDCENVTFHTKIGSDKTILAAPTTSSCPCPPGVLLSQDEKYLQENSFPVIFGKGTIPLYAINAEGSTTQDDLVYNIQYRLKNNKAYSTRKVLPSDPIGYTNELGVVVPYDTSIIDNAYVMSIRSSDSIQDFVNKVDIGNRQGWEEIDDLEIDAAAATARTIPLVPGVNKERIIIKSSLKLTGDVTFDLSTFLVKGGNKFEINFEPVINDDEQYVINFIQDSVTGVILETLGSKMRAGNQIIRFVYDIDELKWNSIKENNSFEGHNHFDPRHHIVSTSETGRVEVAPDGNNILVLEGDKNNIAINDDNNIGNFAYVRFKNTTPINDLYLSKYGNGANVEILRDGVEAQNVSTGTGDVRLFNFIGESQHDTNQPSGRFSNLTINKILHLNLGTKNRNFTSIQGYYMIANSNDRERFTTIPANESLIIRGTGTADYNQPGQNGDKFFGNLTLPSNGVHYQVFITAKARIVSDDGTTTGETILYTMKMYNGSTTVDTAQVGLSLDNNNSWNRGSNKDPIYCTPVVQHCDDFVAAGQVFSLSINELGNVDHLVRNIKFQAICVPI